MVRIDTLCIGAQGAHTVLCFDFFSPELREDKPSGALVLRVIRSFVQTSVFRKLQASFGVDGRPVHIEPGEQALGFV